MVKTWTNVALAGLFLAGGVALTITGHAAEAAGAYVTATALAVGPKVATAVAARRSK